LESLVAIDRNRWSPSVGTTGRHRLDLVVGINWNDWSSSIGTGGRHHVVRAHSVVATTLMGVLVVLSAVSGILISLHHRGVERRKFEHILNCEEALGLHGPNLIGGVKLPDKLRLRDAFIPSVNNTVVFIIRLHLAILFFALVVTGSRWFAA
jgi:hypothetical protein